MPLPKFLANLKTLPRGQKAALGAGAVAATGAGLYSYRKRAKNPASSSSSASSLTPTNALGSLSPDLSQYGQVAVLVPIDWQDGANFGGPNGIAGALAPAATAAATTPAAKPAKAPPPAPYLVKQGAQPIPDKLLALNPNIGKGAGPNPGFKPYTIKPISSYLAAGYSPAQAQAFYDTDVATGKAIAAAGGPPRGSILTDVLGARGKEG